MGIQYAQASLSKGEEPLPRKPLEECQLAELLAFAVEELRCKQLKPALPMRLPRELILAASIEEAAALHASGDPSAIGTLYLMFAPQSDWDDANGSMDLGNRLCEVLHPLWKATR
jgi:hypothetical protein